MPRRPRAVTDSAGEIAYHVLNRAVRRAALFECDAEFEEFELLIWQSLQRVPIRLLAYSAMRTHFHLIVWPNERGELSRFMHRLSVLHATRWHDLRDTKGTGPVYQGRFKAKPICDTNYFLTACRYVERNALAAGVVGRAEDWRWSSLWRRCHGQASGLLTEWPVARPPNWLDIVNLERPGDKSHRPDMLFPGNPAPAQRPATGDPSPDPSPYR